MARRLTDKQRKAMFARMRTSPLKAFNPSDIADERCYCGHRKSAHKWGHWVAHDNTVEPIAKHHGGCTACKCPQFTFKAFIMKDGSEE
jgi:hypothetical protein